jgi:hypothetical protein
LKELILSGRIPANPRGTYISFNKFDRPIVARSRLQLPSKTDGAICLEFDTLQIAGDVRIPYAKYDKADYLEPLIMSYRKWGTGGATQAVTNMPIQLTRIVNLHTGDVLYEWP